MSIFTNDLVLKNILDKLDLKDILSLYQTGNMQIRSMIQEWFQNASFQSEQVRKMYASCLDQVMEEDPDLFTRYFEPYGYNENYYFDVHEKRLKQVLRKYKNILPLLRISEEDALQQVTIEDILDLPLPNSQKDDIVAINQMFYEDLLTAQKNQFKKFLFLLSDDDFNALIDEIETQSYGSYKNCLEEKHKMMNEILMNWR